MKKFSLKRGKSQALVKFLPNSFADFYNNFLKIENWYSKETLTDYPHKRVLERIKLKTFKEKEEIFDKAKKIKFYVLNDDLIENDSYDIIGSISPLTFLCNDCKFICSYFNIDVLGSKPKCPNCNSKDYNQWDMIAVSNYGRISIYTKDKSKLLNLYFKGGVLDKSDSSPKKWNYITNGSASITLSEYFKKMNSNMSLAERNDKEFADIISIKASKVFIPVIDTIINFSMFKEESNYFRTEDELLSNKENKIKLLLFYLGLTDKNFSSENSKISSLYENVQKGILSLDVLPQEFQEDIKKYEETAKFKSKNIHLIENDSVLTSSSLEIYEYLTLIEASENNKTTFNSVIEEVKLINKQLLNESKNNSVLDLEKVRHYEEFSKEKINCSNIFLITDLPILTFSSGYYRGTFEQTNAKLISFSSEIEKDKNELVIYGVDNKTEGIVFELDRKKIINWLLSKKIITSENIDLEQTNNELYLKEWFLNNIKTEIITRNEEISKEEIITKEVYSLLHTLSHIFINKSSKYSGLDTDSISEMIFPKVPAILIYDNNNTDFTLGGLSSLYKEYFIEFIDDIFDGIKCMYDPICKYDSGACHSCLYLSEFNCCHSNQDLGRHYIYGRIEKNGSENEGFFKRYY